MTEGDTIAVIAVTRYRDKSGVPTCCADAEDGRKMREGM